MSRWQPLILVALLVPLFPGAASSAPSDLGGGVLLVHHPPGLRRAATHADSHPRYYQECAIASCSEQNCRIDVAGQEGEASVWFVLAAWDEGKEWRAFEFGLGDYAQQTYVFRDWGPCSPGQALELNTPNWPGPNEGVSVASTDLAWEGKLVPIYWFAGYAYQDGLIPLTPHPITGFGGFAGCGETPSVWPAEAYGQMGLSCDGSAVCPGSSEPPVPAAGSAEHSRPLVMADFELAVEGNPGSSPRILWALRAEADVSLRLFDINGRLVRILADGPSEAGRHSLPWEARDAEGRTMPAGIYYLRPLLNGVPKEATTLLLVR